MASGFSNFNFSDNNESIEEKIIDFQTALFAEFAPEVLRYTKGYKGEQNTSYTRETGRFQNYAKAVASVNQIQRYTLNDIFSKLKKKNNKNNKSVKPTLESIKSWIDIAYELAYNSKIIDFNSSYGIYTAIMSSIISTFISRAEKIANLNLDNETKNKLKQLGTLFNPGKSFAKLREEIKNLEAEKKPFFYPMILTKDIININEIQNLSAILITIPESEDLSLNENYNKLLAFHKQITENENMKDKPIVIKQGKNYKIFSERLKDEGMKLHDWNFSEDYTPKRLTHVSELNTIDERNTFFYHFNQNGELSYKFINKFGDIQKGNISREEMAAIQENDDIDADISKKKLGKIFNILTTRLFENLKFPVLKDPKNKENIYPEIKNTASIELNPLRDTNPLLYQYFSLHLNPVIEETVNIINTSSKSNLKYENNRNSKKNNFKLPEPFTQEQDTIFTAEMTELLNQIFPSKDIQEKIINSFTKIKELIKSKETKPEDKFLLKGILRMLENKNMLMSEKMFYLALAAPKHPQLMELSNSYKRKYDNTFTIQEKNIAGMSDSLKKLHYISMLLNIYITDNKIGKHQKRVSRLKEIETYINHTLKIDNKNQEILFKNDDLLDQAITLKEKYSHSKYENKAKRINFILDQIIEFSQNQKNIKEDQVKISEPSQQTTIEQNSFMGMTKEEEKEEMIINEIEDPNLEAKTPSDSISSKTPQSSSEQETSQETRKSSEEVSDGIANELKSGVINFIAAGKKFREEVEEFDKNHNNMESQLALSKINRILDEYQKATNNYETLLDKHASFLYKDENSSRKNSLQQLLNNEMKKLDPYLANLIDQKKQFLNKQNKVSPPGHQQAKTPVTSSLKENISTQKPIEVTKPNISNNDLKKPINSSYKSINNNLHIQKPQFERAQNPTRPTLKNTTSGEAITNPKIPLSQLNSLVNTQRRQATNTNIKNTNLRQTKANFSLKQTSDKQNTILPPSAIFTTSKRTEKDQKEQNLNRIQISGKTTQQKILKEDTRQPLSIKNMQYERGDWENRDWENRVRQALANNRAVTVRKDFNEPGYLIANYTIQNYDPNDPKKQKKLPPIDVKLKIYSNRLVTDQFSQDAFKALLNTFVLLHPQKELVINDLENLNQENKEIIINVLNLEEYKNIPRSREINELIESKTNAIIKQKN